MPASRRKSISGAQTTGPDPGTNALLPECGGHRRGQHDFPAILAGIAGTSDKQIARFQAIKWFQGERRFTVLIVDKCGRKLLAPSDPALRSSPVPRHSSTSASKDATSALIHARSLSRVAAFTTMRYRLGSEVVGNQVINHSAAVVQHATVERLSLCLCSLATSFASNFCKNAIASLPVTSTTVM